MAVPLKRVHRSPKLALSRNFLFSPVSKQQKFHFILLSLNFVEEKWQQAIGHARIFEQLHNLCDAFNASFVKKRAQTLLNTTMNIEHRHTEFWLNFFWINTHTTEIISGYFETDLRSIVGRHEIVIMQSGANF